MVYKIAHYTFQAWLAARFCPQCGKCKEDCWCHTT